MDFSIAEFLCILKPDLPLQSLQLIIIIPVVGMEKWGGLAKKKKYCTFSRTDKGGRLPMVHADNSMLS